MSFLRPKASTPAPAPPPPTMTDTEGAQQDYQDQLAKRQGRASTLLTTPQSRSTPTTASKVLLGQ